MHRLVAMVRKDLLRQVRSPVGMGVILLFPLIFSGMLALVFGTGDTPGLPRVQLRIDDQDKTILSGLLVSAAGGEQLAKYFDVRAVGPEGLAEIENGKASALLQIPSGFSEKLLRGEPVVLTLIRNPAESIMPEIAEQALVVFSELLASASRALRQPLDEIVPLIESEQGPTAAQTAAVAVAIHGLIEQSGGFVLPPAITLENVQLGDDTPRGGNSHSSIFLLILPGISVWSLFLVGDLSMRDLLTESQAGTLRRQLSAPLRPIELIVGKSLSTAMMATLSLILLSGIGWLASSGEVSLVGFAALSAALILAVTGFSATVYGLARTERQGATVSSVILLVFAFIGGSFLQVQSLPPGVRRFSPLSPFYWGTEGYRELIANGAGWVEILPNVGVLGGIGVVTLFLGGVLLGRRTLQGAVA